MSVMGSSVPQSMPTELQLSFLVPDQLNKGVLLLRIPLKCVSVGDNPNSSFVGGIETLSQI
jgi:hypothetical protein